MQTVTLSVPSITDQRTAMDLSNAVMPISGVAGVATDTMAHTLTVEFDTDYLKEGSLRTMVGKLGYPVEGT